MINCLIYFTVFRSYSIRLENLTKMDINKKSPRKFPEAHINILIA